MPARPCWPVVGGLHAKCQGDAGRHITEDRSDVAAYQAVALFAAKPDVAWQWVGKSFHPHIRLLGTGGTEREHQAEDSEAAHLRNAKHSRTHRANDRLPSCGVPRHSRQMVPLSVLDLSPSLKAATPARRCATRWTSRATSRRWGYRRYWMAEHHNLPGIACAATAVALAHIAAGTRSIRIGAGGIMLPNHAPLLIAEQFGTLAHCIRGGSNWDWGARRDPIRSPRGRCGERCTAAATSSRRTSSS